MKLPFKGFKIISPFFWAAFFVLANLFFCTGCEKKQGVRIGDTPPVISGNDIHGEHVNLSKLKGKIFVIYFWTNSCCGDNLKKLEPYYRENKDKGLIVLAVNVGDSKEIVESYTKNNVLTFTMLTDEHAKLFKEYQAFGYPTIYILDKNGIVREKILGDIQTEKLQALVIKQFKIQKDVEANYEKIHPR